MGPWRTPPKDYDAWQYRIHKRENGRGGLKEKREMGRGNKGKTKGPKEEKEIGNRKEQGEEEGRGKEEEEEGAKGRGSLRRKRREVGGGRCSA